MNPQSDEEILENDVHYGIADCRRRLRSQRSSLRAQHHPPKDGSNGVNSAASEVPSYAEIFASVSMNQGSLAKLVDCLLAPADEDESSQESSEERQEAVIT